jgi:hypothetical protein
METLHTPDVCARLDTMKRMCDRLEDLQDQPEKYRELVRRIQREANELCDTVCRIPPEGAPAPKRGADR